MELLLGRRHPTAGDTPEVRGRFDAGVGGVRAILLRDRTDLVVAPHLRRFGAIDLRRLAESSLQVVRKRIIYRPKASMAASVPDDDPSAIVVAVDDEQTIGRKRELSAYPIAPPDDAGISATTRFVNRGGARRRNDGAGQRQYRQRLDSPAAPWLSPGTHSPPFFIRASARLWPLSTSAQTLSRALFWPAVIQRGTDSLDVPRRLKADIFLVGSEEVRNVGNGTDLELTVQMLIGVAEIVASLVHRPIEVCRPVPATARSGSFDEPNVIVVTHDGHAAVERHA